MRTIVVRQSSAAPVDIVWELATDLAHAPDTISGIDSVELHSDGDFGVGTRWTETRTMFGRSASETMEITAVDAGRSYTAEAESSGMHYVTTWDFTPTDAGSEIVMRFSGTPTSRISRVTGVLASAMSSSVEKAMRADMADLARAAEARA